MNHLYLKNYYFWIKLLTVNILILTIYTITDQSSLENELRDFMIIGHGL